MRNKFLLTFVSMAIVFLLTAGMGLAHFGMVIPTQSIVGAKDKQVDLSLSFSHPFAMVGMDLEKPERFYVVRDGQRTDLLGSLKQTEILGHQGWQTTYPIRRPGVYHFVMEPAPYWEPAEETLIIHYTKTIVAAYGFDSGWDKPIGIETEIVPLLRPFGNYAGNSFSGQVLIRGKPAANTEVEVELFNEARSFTPPSVYHVTQTVRTDANGIFTFTCPQPGWWGFAALSEADYTLKNPEGRDTSVELGAVLWIYLDEFRKK